jgi:hypothetical protein
VQMAATHSAAMTVLERLGGAWGESYDEAVRKQVLKGSNADGPPTSSVVAHDQRMTVAMLNTGTCFLRQLGHRSVTNEREMKVIDGFSQVAHSNLQTRHLNQ